MAGEVGVRAVDLRLVAVRRRDAALQIVRDPDRRTALKVVEHADVRADPRRQVLAPRGLGVDQAARAEHADEEFDRRPPRRSSDRPGAAASRRNRQTASRRRDAPGASTASAPAPTGDTARRTGCRRTRPDAPRAILLPQSSASVTPGFFSSWCSWRPVGHRPGRGPAGPPAAQTARASSAASSRSSGSGHVRPAAVARCK